MFRSFAVIPILLASATVAYAESGRVEGVVRSANERALAGVVVQVEGSTLSATTDAEGRFVLEGLAVGTSVKLVATYGNLPPEATTAYVSQDGTTYVRFTFRSLRIPERAVAASSERAHSGRVEGVVRSANGEAIGGAVVTADGYDVVATTDADGRFVVAGLRAGATVRLIATVAGLPQERTSAYLSQSGATYVQFMMRMTKTREEVTVRADIPLLNAADRISTVTLSPEQIGVLPSLGEKDIFRALQLLPGVSGSRESSSGLYVRGGTPAQNLISYDGFTIYYVDHLFGYFSAFNMDAVDQVRLSKSAFEARDGGRLSSVLDLSGKTGRRDRIGGSAGVSLLSVHALVEAPLGKRASLIVAGRRSFQGPLYGKILDLFGNNDTPGGGAPRVSARAGSFGGGGRFSLFESEPKSYFYDANAKLLWEPSTRDKITLSLYDGRDVVDNSRTLTIPDFMLQRMTEAGLTPPDSFAITDTRQWENRGLGAQWKHAFGRGVEARVSLGYSRFQNLTDRASASGSGSFMPGPGGTGGPGGDGAGAVEDNDLTDLTARFELAVPLRWNNLVEVGAMAIRNNVDYNYETSADARFRPGETGSETRPQFGGQLNRDQKAQQYVFHVQDRWTAFKRLTLAPGLRVTRYDLTDRTYTEPRVSASLALTSRVRLKTAWGVQHQFANRITREDAASGDREFWTLADGTSVPVARSRQAVAGLAYETRDMLIDGEVFDRELSGLAQFSPQFGPRTADQAPDLGRFFHQGDGSARGLEVLAQKKFGRQVGWVSYTWSKVEYRFPTLAADPFPASHDQTHELKLVDTVRVGRWTLAGTWIYATGQPYTQASGVETTTIDERFAFDRLILGERNAAHLPAYHRMDLAAHCDIRLGLAKGTVSATLFNVYGRRNVWYKEFQVVEGEIIENNVLLMGRTLNISLSARF
jgi:ferric enterobactin receptor